MQVSAAAPSLPQSQLAPNQRQATFANGQFPTAAPAPAPEAPPPAAAAPETETVELHDAAVQAAAMPEAPQPAPRAEVFAEIWKDGVKIGSVYTDGTAILPSAQAGAAAGIHNGARLPYLQAQEISRMVGGEVRLVDLGALHTARTRTQLRTAYGA